MFVFFKPSNRSGLGHSGITYHFVKPQGQSSTAYKESEPEIELIMVLCKLPILKMAPSGYHMIFLRSRCNECLVDPDLFSYMAIVF